MTVTAPKTTLPIKTLTTAFMLASMADQAWARVTRLGDLRSTPVDSWCSLSKPTVLDVDFPKMQGESLVLPRDGGLSEGATITDYGKVIIPITVVHRPDGAPSRTFVAWDLTFFPHNDQSVDLSPQLTANELARFTGPAHSLVMRPEELNAMLTAVVGCGIHPGRLVSVLSDLGALVMSDARIQGMRWGDVGGLSLVQGVIVQALMKSKPWAQD